MLSKRSRQLILLLLLTIAFSALFNESIESPAPTQSSAREEKPAAFTTQSTFTAYEGEGPAKMEITSQRSIFYAQKNEIEIDAPRIVYTDDTQNVYTLSAEKGRFLVASKQLSLNDDVRVTQQNTDTQAPLHLTTSQLHFDTENRFISTDQVVTIKRGLMTLSAIGLEADLDPKILTLHQRVRGKYVRN